MPIPVSSTDTISLQISPLISESTYELVRDYVDAITIKNVAIRGKANRINLYEVIRLVD